MATGDFVLTVPQMRDAVQLYQSGLSLRQVADRFDVSKNAVKNALRYQDVQIRPKHEARRLRWTMC